MRVAASLDEGLSLVVSLDPSFSPEVQNNNRLIHLSAPLHTAQVHHLFTVPGSYITLSLAPLHTPLLSHA